MVSWSRNRSIKELSMLKTSHVLFSAVLAIAMSAMLPARSTAQPLSSAGGAVFVMTNAAGNNEIIAYKRNADGSLQEGRTYKTGGRGSGGVTDPLASQGSIRVSLVGDDFVVAGCV